MSIEFIITDHVLIDLVLNEWIKGIDSDEYEWCMKWYKGCSIKDSVYSGIHFTIKYSMYNPCVIYPKSLLGIYILNTVLEELYKRGYTNDMLSLLVDNIEKG